MAALITANRSGNEAELLKILGPHAKELIFSGDVVADKEGRDMFVAAYDAAHKLEKTGDSKEVLIVGHNAWPLPIPLVRQNNSWWFDTAAGEQEILDRRIGRNELNVIEICRAYVKAQREYADKHFHESGKFEYAQHFLSHEGKRDGLYWPTNHGENESPMGPLIAFAEAENSNAIGDVSQHKPYHGYYYKILTRQSKYAPRGSINYIVNGGMTGGFALLAFPAKYGDSGIKTFMVNQDGFIYEKDLGPNTSRNAAAITQYNPDQSWKVP